MIAEVAAKLIAKFVSKQWPTDKLDLFEILKLGMNKAWQEGKWLGMTSEFMVNIYRDENGQPYIIGPPTHPILLAINSNGKPAKIRDKYFMFHRNGAGDIRNNQQCFWNQDVYDLGSQPYFNKHNIKFSDGVTVGVRSIGLSGPNEKVYINGKYMDGKSIYTYKESEYGESCGCKSDLEEIDTVKGVELKIGKEFNYISNIKFSSIDSITKTITRSPVEVIIIDEFNRGYVIAELSPNQKFSKYRKYLVPDQLCNGRDCLHAIFKIAQQEDIVGGTDSLMISNEEAIICLAKGIYNLYYKEQQEVGASYILQGIGILDKEKREEESPNEFPIQVDTMSYEDLPTALRYNH